MKQNFKRQIKLEEVLKKNDKLYVKQKGYDNSFNTSIDEMRYHYVK